MERRKHGNGLETFLEHWGFPLVVTTIALITSAVFEWFAAAPRWVFAVLIVVVLTVLGGAVWLSEHSVKRRALKRMQTRPARTPEEFGRDLFSPECAPIAAHVRKILGRYLTVDLSRLSPEDTFVDLEIAELDSMATVGFIVDLEREFGIKISDSDAGKMKTFRDVVEYVSQAVRQSRPNDDD